MRDKIGTSGMYVQTGTPMRLKYWFKVLSKYCVCIWQFIALSPFISMKVVTLAVGKHLAGRRLENFQKPGFFNNCSFI